MDARTKMYKLVRAIYEDLTESALFPETYEKATSIEAASNAKGGDGLATFLAVESWEVMDGLDTFRDCRREVVRAIEGAICELSQVKEQLLDRFEKHADRVAECQNCGAVFEDGALNPVKDLMQRVDPEELMPAGECPRCGAVCHFIRGENS